MTAHPAQSETEASPRALPGAGLILPDEAATRRAGAALAAAARPGDTFLLAGVLGAGKSALARGFVTARTGAAEVPSPSYTLVNVYDAPGGAVWHADLYRLGGEAGEIAELGLAAAFGEAIVLVEWPDRLGRYLPPRWLALRLEVLPGEARRLHVRPEGPGWEPALAALGGSTA